ncbi:MAG: hypothetical protein R3181_07610 [Rubricoccaceae bacterium]|nr:hypothetical protein [Rubricoccaceae bacterium]
MDPIIWIASGLVVGLAAARAAGGRDGLFGDLLFGLLGAFLGGWLTDLLYTGTVLDGLAASAPAALVGAVVFVLGLRLVQRTSLA